MDPILQTFAAELEKISGLPVGHLRADKKAVPPYIAWYAVTDLNLYADDVVYVFLGYQVMLEIYSRTDGEGLEIMKKLKEAGYGVELQDDNYIEMENLWVTFLEVSVLEQKDQG